MIRDKKIERAKQLECLLAMLRLTFETAVEVYFSSFHRRSMSALCAKMFSVWTVMFLFMTLSTVVLAVFTTLRLLQVFDSSTEHTLNVLKRNLQLEIK